MIAARIAADIFIAWRLDGEPRLPAGLEPVRDGGGPWLLLAVAELRVLRVAGLPIPGRRHIAAWLVPCRIDRHRIGNLFLSAISDDPLVVAAYAALGLPGSTCGRLRAEGGRISAPGVCAKLGGAIVAPDLSWFARDRCGLIAARGGIHRLPLAKRGWHHAIRAVEVQAGPTGARPVAAIDCSGDLAVWGLPRRLAGAVSLPATG